MRKVLRLALAVVFCVFLGRQALAADWPMWRMDEHRSGITATAIPDTLHLQWSWTLPIIDRGFGTYEYCHEPVVMGHRMFVPSSRNDMLLALNTETGLEEWRFYAEGPIRTAPAAYRLPSLEERVYVTSDDGHLYCLNAETGALVWKMRGGPSNRKLLGFDRLISAWPCMTSPVVRNGMVYFTAGLFTAEGVFVYALDADTGSVVWVNDSGFGNTRADAIADQAPLPLGAGGRSEGELLTPSLQGYPVVMNDSTEMIVPVGNDGPAYYYLGTGSMRKWDDVSKYCGLLMWYDGNGDQIVSRPTSIQAGGRTWLTQDAVALGAIGSVYTLIAADDRLFAVTSQGNIYCFGAATVSNPPDYSLSVTPLSNTQDTWTDAVQQMLVDSGITTGTGVALVWGIGTGRLSEELLKQSNLIVESFDADDSTCIALKSKFDDAGMYGIPGPSGVHIVAPMEQGVSPTIARLIAVEDLNASGFSSGVDFVKKLYRSLRPNGGQGWLPTTLLQHSNFEGWVQNAGLLSVIVTRNSDWTVIERTGVPGGLANVVKPPFGVLWFAKPNYSLHDKYSGGAQRCINIDGSGGGFTSNGTAPAGDDPGSIIVNPLTWLPEERTIYKGYGCAGTRDHGNLWVARSGCFAAYDKWRESGTIHLVNARPTCSETSWQMDDGTMFLYAPGCSCAYALRTSISFVPMNNDELPEQWAAWSGYGRLSAARVEDAPIRRIGVNFGAPGCWNQEDGSLWIDAPKWSDFTPSIPLEFSPESPDRFYHHASRIIGGDSPKWVVGSGVKGIDSITIGLTRTAVAVRSSGMLSIDGVLDEACWDGVSPVYLSHDDVYGQHASENAYVRYDDANLYVGIKKDGDYTGSTEAFNVYLSSRDTKNATSDIIMTYLRFGLNAIGERFDALSIENTAYNVPEEDPSWNPTWQGGVKVNTQSFVAEMAIPWSVIEAEGVDRDVMLINIWGPDMIRVGALSLSGIPTRGYEPASDRACERFIPLNIDNDMGITSMARPYKVKLHFAEIFDVAIGERVFDVKLQGQTVLSHFDIIAEAGGKNIGVVKEFDLDIKDALEISFVPIIGEPLICGVEIVNEPINGINVAPVADAKAFPASGVAPLPVFLSAVDSYDLNDAVLTYTWDFGDEEVGVGRDLYHTYYAGGTYTAVLTVTDPWGVTDTASVQIIGTGAGNLMPTCSITTPLNGTTLLDPAKIAITAIADDADGTIAKVEFYNGTTLMRTDTTSPYAYTMFSVPAGTYPLTIKATDDGGAVKTSTIVLVTVTADGNIPPQIISQLTDTATVGQNFSYTIAASGTQPITFGASGLPAGLTRDGAVISGTPVSIGTSSVTLTATNSEGMDTETLVLTINAALLPTYTITANAGVGGTLTPSGEVTVTEGDTRVFTIGENVGYETADVLVDGASQGVLPNYTFSNVIADHSIAILFSAIPDSEAPTVPSSLVAVAASSVQINLTWAASTDDIGVAGYDIWRGGVLIDTATGTTYSDAGLSSEATYSYTVAAFDAAGNRSSESSSVEATTPAAQNMLAHWMLDETTGDMAYDATGNGHSGTLVSSPSWTMDGYIGGALIFNDIYDRIELDAPLAPGAENSIAVWFTAPLMVKDWLDLVSGDAGASFIKADHYILGINNGSFVSCGFDMNTLSDGWHHVAAVATGTVTEFYIDGVHVGTSAGKVTVPVMVLGNDYNGGAALSSTVDDVRIYGRALGAAEIAVLAGGAVDTDTDGDGTPDDTDLDDDGDGMPDVWEIANGFDPLVNEDTGLDFDNDGMSNLDESICGTDPNDGISKLETGNLTIDGSGIAVTFDTVLGRLYDVECIDDLTGANWSNMATNIQGTGEAVNVNDPAPIGRRFYRIRVKLAE